MLLRRIASFYIVLQCILFVVYPAYSGFKEAHKHEDIEYLTKTTRFSVSARSKTFFDQPDYTYSFPFVADRDEEILQTLAEVFGKGIYAVETRGTYSISIDYDPSLQSKKVYQQTRYLVESDTLTPRTIIRDGYRLFCSKAGYAPRYYREGGGKYHMENALMLSLENDASALLRGIFDEIPENSKILGVGIKFYQSYDCCPACRLNVLKNIPYFQKIFDEKIRSATKTFTFDEQPIPFMISGLMFRYYGRWYKTFIGSKCQTSEAADYGTALFPKKNYHAFAGKIDGSAPQDMMPVYIHMQPSTNINSDKTITLEQCPCPAE